MYLFLKGIHTLFAALSIAGFMLRGYWMLAASPMLKKPATRIAPHVVDTLFLVTGIWLIVELDLAVLQNGWLLAKFAGLIAYIALGMIALRFGRSSEIRLLAFIGAIAVYAYIVGVAYAKSAMSWIAF